MENVSDARRSNLQSCQDIRRLQRRLVFGLLALTLITFISACGNGFVQYDDSINIYGNLHIRSLSAENLKWMFTDTSFAQRYMPLGWFSYAIDYQFFGASPVAYHTGNLLLHLVNTVLLFFLLKRLLLLTAGKFIAANNERTIVWCAALGALFWAVNPLRTEPIAWASSRPYCVMFFLAMISLLAWLHARTVEMNRSRRVAWYAVSVAAYGASLLTYPLALFLPIVFSVLDAYRLRCIGRRLSEWNRADILPILKDKVPFFAVAATMIAVSFLARVATDLDHRPTTLQEFGFLSRTMQALYVWSYYVWKPWFPYDLAVCYPTLNSFNPLGLRFIVSAVSVVAVTLLALKMRQRWPGIFALWLCHLALLIPVLGLTEYPHSACDRYSYLHGTLWSAGIAALLMVLWHRRKQGHLAAIAIGSACLVFAFSAYQQIAVWNNPISFYRQVIAVHGEHPHRARFDEVLARNYLSRGMTNEAIASLEDAIRYESRRADRGIYGSQLLPRAHVELGDVFTKQGQREQAIIHYREALKIDPNLPQLQNKLGDIAKFNSP